MSANALALVFLPHRGTGLPSDVDLVALVGGGFVLGYLGRFVFRLIFSDLSDSMFDAASELQRRHCGILIGVIAFVYWLVAQGFSASPSVAHHPMAAFGVVGAYTAGTWLGATLGFIAGKTGRKQGPAKETSVGSVQMQLMGTIAAIIWLTLWASTGQAAKTKITPPKITQRCHQIKSSYARSYEHRHQGTVLQVCSSRST